MRNAGTKTVTFSVGSNTAGLGDVFGFKSVLKPGQHITRLLYLSTRGLIPYYVGESYMHATSAEKGKLLVGATCSVCAPPGPPIPP